jgi:hypothetical protein
LERDPSRMICLSAKSSRRDGGIVMGGFRHQPKQARVGLLRGGSVVVHCGGD